MPLLVNFPKPKIPGTSPLAILNSDWDVLLSEVKFLYSEELKHLHIAERHFDCPQELSLDSHCKMDISVKT